MRLNAKCIGIDVEAEVIVIIIVVIIIVKITHEVAYNIVYVQQIQEATLIAKAQYDVFPSYRDAELITQVLTLNVVTLKYTCAV